MARPSLLEPSTRWNRGSDATARSAIPPLVLWAGLVVVGVALVLAVDASGTTISIEAAPFHARVEPEITENLLPALAVGCMLLWWAPQLARRLSWARLVVTATGASIAWALALASVRGLDRVAAPVHERREYLAVLPSVSSVGDFLAGFTDHLASYPVHVQGHPPGTVVIAWALDRVGLGGGDPFALLLVVGGGLAVAAALVAARDVAGIEFARRAAPFLVAAPTAIWVATSADALVAGVSAWAATLVVLATGNRARRRGALAVSGGVLFGVAALLSYGAALVAAVPLAVAWRRRAVQPILTAALGGAAVLLAFWLAGFWWFGGLAATHERYVAGIASRRPYELFLVGNLAELALALGPAIAVGLARLRDRAAWLLVGGGLAAVVLADLSGMSKGEVERIWLPFTPWILLAGAALLVREDVAAGAARTVGAWARRPAAAGWLGSQIGVAILIESLIRTPW